MADDTRQRLLEAAGPIFAHKGFEAATVREICAQAGTNLASVNYYFGDKETLYLETVRWAHATRMARVPPPVFPPEMTAEEKLRQFVHALLSRMLESPELDWSACLLIREIIQPTHVCKAMVEDFIRPQLNQLLEVLDELLPEDVPRHRRYQTAFSLVGQCMYYRIAGPLVDLLIPLPERRQHYEVAQLAEHIAGFTLRAIRGCPSGDGGTRSSAGNAAAGSERSSS